MVEGVIYRAKSDVGLRSETVRKLRDRLEHGTSFPVHHVGRRVHRIFVLKREVRFCLGICD